MKKLSFYLIVLLLLVSCNAVKGVGENEHLLTEVTVLLDSIENKDDAIIKFVIQKPNTKTLGIAPLPLYFYNLGDNKYPKSSAEWGKKKSKTYNFIKGVFSEKQSIAYARTSIGFNNWFLKGGEPPVIINEKKTEKTVKNLRTYFTTIGYFKSEVNATTNKINDKKGTIEYNIKKGKPLFLDTIQTQIQSPELDSIYKLAKGNSFLKKGDQYNETNFINEAERITNLFRNNGGYYFSNSSVGFFDIDSAGTTYKTNVLLKISDRIIENDGNYDTKNFRIQKINDVKVVTDYSYTTRNDPYRDSISYEGFTFLAHQKIKYNPKYLAQSLFVRKDSIYSDSLRNSTRSHLKTLNNFKGINITYNQAEGTNNELNTTIFLTPIEKYSLGLDTELTHSNIREIGVSGKFSLINRNTFRGAEILKFSVSGSWFNSNRGPGWEIGADISTEIPRFVAPFGLSRLVPKRMFPKTIFSIGTSIQKNIGLDRQTFSILADYKWQHNQNVTKDLEVFNTQYIRNFNVSNYFDIYNSEFKKLNEIAQIYNNGANFPLQGNPKDQNEILSFINTISQDATFKNSNPDEFSTNQNIKNRYNIITSDFIVPVIAYSYSYNNQSNYKDSEFSFFKIRIANSGNLMGVLSNQRNDDNIKTVFGIPIAQYFKTDIEFKHFWDLKRNSVFGVRTFLGAIYAYDGSNIPFTKSYFAGGSNDIRAWQTYSLGPGKTNTGLEFNVGSLKFLTSAEYRFDIFGSFKGALFIDAGNIWDVTSNNMGNTDGKFTGLESLKDIAIGSGLGVRYDFNFLVLRLDVGFKTYEPYLENDKWFQNYSLSKAVYNIGINYPF
jgi:outer membrane protein assembly factor BamA